MNNKELSKSKKYLHRIISLILVAIVFLGSTISYISTLAIQNDGLESGFELNDNGLVGIEAIEETDDGIINDDTLNQFKQKLEAAQETALIAKEKAIVALSEIANEKSLYALLYLCEFYEVKHSPDEALGTVATLYSGQTVEIKGIDFDKGEFWYLVNFYLLNNNISGDEITDNDFTLYSGYIESSFLAYSDELLLAFEEEYLVAWFKSVMDYENYLFELELYLERLENIDDLIDEETESDFLIEEDLGEYLEEFESFFMAVDFSFNDISLDDTGLMATAFSLNTSPDIEQFPESYRSALYALKEKYPMWTFVRMNTYHNWGSSIYGQINPAHRSLIYDTAMASWKGSLYEGRWHIATKDAVEHIMDPRNNLTESWIFQFEQLTYNSSYHNINSLNSILASTFMNGIISDATITYAQAFMTLGQKYGISPYHLAARVRQEQGAGTSPLISGKHSIYPGIYNYFNVGASGSTTALVIENGLIYAKNAGWDSRFKSLDGGSATIGNNYIKKGQDTLYLQKFNVAGANNGAYHHQYMQNIQAPRTEAVTTYNSYRNTLSNAFVFKIPVYDGMPLNEVPANPGAAVSPSPSVSPEPSTSPSPSVSPSPSTSPNPSVSPSPSTSPSPSVSPSPSTSPSPSASPEPSTSPSPSVSPEPSPSTAPDVPAEPINALSPSITTQPAGKMLEQNISISSLSVSASAPDSGTLTYQWYQNAVAIPGATNASYVLPVSESLTNYYYVMVTNSINDNGDGGTKKVSIISDTVTVTVTDTIPPTGMISINGNTFNQFLNTLTFGLFFKSSQTVTITAADSGSGVDKIEWLALNQEFADEAEARATSGWLYYDETNKPSLSADFKGAVYTKISDKAGNLTVINSDGFIIYNDTTANIETIGFIKGTADDKSILLSLDGNMIKTIHNGAELIDPKYYSIEVSLDNNNGKLIFSKDFLNKLPTGQTILTISYEAKGEAEIKADTIIVLNITSAPSTSTPSKPNPPANQNSNNNTAPPSVQADNKQIEQAKSELAKQPNQPENTGDTGQNNIGNKKITRSDTENSLEADKGNNNNNEKNNSANIIDSNEEIIIAELDKESDLIITNETGEGISNNTAPDTKHTPLITTLVASNDFMFVIIFTIGTVLLGCGIAIIIRLKK